MKRNFKFLLTFLLLAFQATYAQKVEMISLENADALLDKKFKVNNTFSIYSNYSIQLASTNKNEAESIYNLFVKNFPKEDATIIYSQPNFKVLVGNFRNKIEAVHFLNQIKKIYPNAYVVRLKK